MAQKSRTDHAWHSPRRAAAEGYQVTALGWLDAAKPPQGELVLVL